MVTKEIRKIRCDDSLKILMEHNEAVFFTLTTPDRVDYDTVRARWRKLRHDVLRWLRKRYPGRKIHYIMNYELHPGYLQKVVKDSHGERILHGSGQSHGWHIHGVFNCFVPANVFRSYLQRCGFGRFDVRRVKSKGVSDYLTKHALKAYVGLSAKDRQIYQGSRRRLVNASRGLPPLNDYCYTSPHLESVKAVMSEIKQNVSVLKGQKSPEEKIYLDYRVVRQRAEVCAMLGLARSFELVRFLEWLGACGVSPALGYLARRKFDCLTKAPEVASEADDVGFRGREASVRESVFSERGCRGRKNSIVRLRKTFRAS